MLDESFEIGQSQRRISYFDDDDDDIQRQKNRDVISLDSNADPY
jgi:hypothetical protein